MTWLVVYYGFSKYYGCVRKHYVDFNNFGNMVKFLKNKDIQKFTIYQKCDIVDIEKEEEEND